MEWSLYVNCSAIMHECKHLLGAVCGLQLYVKRPWVPIGNGEQGAGRPRRTFPTDALCCCLVLCGFRILQAWELSTAVYASKIVCNTGKALDPLMRAACYTGTPYHDALSSN